MKYIKYLAAMTILCGVSVVSYYVGKSSNDTKNYEAACLQADFIRYLIDHFNEETNCWNIGSEVEECYYEWFTDLDNGIFKTDHIKDIKDFEEYSWCY